MSKAQEVASHIRLNGDGVTARTGIKFRRRCNIDVSALIYHAGGWQWLRLPRR